LQNWNISVRHEQWDKDKGFGDNQIDPNNEHSTITLYDPSTIPVEVQGVRDLEVTLVHELLHIRLVYLSPNSNKTKKKWATEIAIETIAQSLVANRRGIKLEALK